MGTVSIKRATVLLLVLVFGISAVCAGGAAEGGTHTHDDEHHGRGAMAVPHIDAVDLGSGEPLRVVASTSIVGDAV